MGESWNEAEGRVILQRKIARLKAELPAPLLSPEEVRAIFEKVNAINIVDPEARAEHVANAAARRNAKTTGERG